MSHKMFGYFTFINTALELAPR